MVTESDSELLERLNRGDKGAFTELVIRHQKSIYSLAYRLTGDEREAGDITQKVFVNAYSGISKFQRKSEFRTWIFRITVNLCKNYFRSNPEKREVPIEDLPLSQPETPLTRLLEEEQKGRLKSMLDRLPEKQKVTLVLRVYQELSYKEIARIVNSAEGTVKANIFHALNRLRSMWQEED
jgi:RNA polymerase sigma-70 factor (ECF subfamily)